MRRRLLVPVLFLLASCASPYASRQAPPPSPAPRPAAPPRKAAPAPAAPGPVTPPTTSGDMVFDAWASDFYPRAIAAGIRPDVLQREMAGLTPDPRVSQRDSRQPEFSKPIGEYIRGVVTPSRDAIGVRR